MKPCSKCDIEKDLSFFHKKKMGYLGHDSVCKNCRRLVCQIYYNKNKDLICEKNNKYKQENKEKKNNRDKEYGQENRERISAYKKQYRSINKEKVSDQRRKKYLKNKEKEYTYHYNRRKTNINYYLRCILRTRISNFLKGVGEKQGSAVKDLGCSIEEFKLHLESKFIEGMSWENKGKWHVDHIIPLCKFDLSKRDDFLKACHYTNMQPLWAIDNLRKNRF